MMIINIAMSLLVAGIWGLYKEVRWVGCLWGVDLLFPQIPSPWNGIVAFVRPFGNLSFLMGQSSRASSSIKLPYPRP